jgi:hypothetical protein
MAAQMCSNDCRVLVEDYRHSVTCHTRIIHTLPVNSEEGQLFKQPFGPSHLMLELYFVHEGHLGSRCSFQ